MTRILFMELLLLGALYPLFFLSHRQDRIEPGFYRFNTAMAIVPAGVVVLILLARPMSEYGWAWNAAWLITAILAAAYTWPDAVGREYVFVPAAIFGVIAATQMRETQQQIDARALGAGIIGAMTLAGAIYASTLGHWYLSVEKLSIRPLRRASLALTVILAVRLVWDVVIGATVPIVHEGDSITLAAFLTTYDGFLLWVALVFGIVFPLGLMAMVMSTVKIESTQSATGLLYVVLSSILMGELAYKFYLIRFGLPL